LNIIGSRKVREGNNPAVDEYNAWFGTMEMIINVKRLHKNIDGHRRASLRMANSRNVEHL
jgi:hypothetical protein